MCVCVCVCQEHFSQIVETAVESIKTWAASLRNNSSYFAFSVCVCVYARIHVMLISTTFYSQALGKSPCLSFVENSMSRWLFNTLVWFVTSDQWLRDMSYKLKGHLTSLRIWDLRRSRNLRLCSIDVAKLLNASCCHVHCRHMQSCYHIDVPLTFSLLVSRIDQTGQRISFSFVEQREVRKTVSTPTNDRLSNRISIPDVINTSNKWSLP